MITALRSLACTLILQVAIHAVEQVPPAAPAAQAPAVPSGGTITFASLEYDFGRIPVGQIVRTEFQFTNTGTTLLQVTDVRPGCGCTTAGSWDRSVEPGQTGRIPVQFNSMNFNGHVSKPVTVTTSDPAHPTMALRITGEIWRPIELQPNFVYFNSVDPEVSATKVAWLTNNTSEPITVSDLKNTNSMFQVELKEVQPGKVFQFVISTVAPLEGVNPQTQITAKTSSTNMPEVKFTAMATVHPPVTATPGTIMLPAGALTGTTRYIVSVRNNRPTQPMTITEVKCTLEGVTTAIQEQEAGRLYAVEVIFPQGLEMKPGEMGQLSITTTHPKLQNLSVNVVQLTNGARPPRFPGTAALPAPTPPPPPAPSITGPVFTNGAVFR